MNSLFLPMSLLFWYASLTCHATDYYVSPTGPSDPDCPVGEPCFTVDHYAQEFTNTSYHDGKHNITLTFLQGIHNLTQNLDVKWPNIFVLRGISDNFSVVLILNANISIDRAVKTVIFNSLKFDNGYRQFHSVSISQPSPDISIQINLEQVLFSDVSFLMTGKSIWGNVHIAESQFICSNIDIQLAYQATFNISLLSSSFYSGPLGNSLNVDGTSSVLSIQLYNTSIQDIGAYRPDSVCQPYQSAPVINTTMLTSTQYCDLRIYASQIYPLRDIPAINITKSEFSRTYSTGICLLMHSYNSLGVQITDSKISNHKEGAMLVTMRHHLSSDIDIAMKDCNVFNNTLETTSHRDTESPLIATTGISITDVGNTKLHVLIANSTFFDNSAYESSAVISFLRVTNITINNCHFVNNTGSSIMAYQSTFTLSGDVSFEDNIATKGGALSLTLSTVNITDGSNIVFRNNSAIDVGGAINVEQLSANLYLDNDEQTVTQCFYQLIGDIDTAEYSLTFINNTAMNGGDHVFGTSLQSYCIVGYRGYIPDNSYNAQGFFHFQPTQSNRSNFSLVASIPTRVCICDLDGEFDCSNVSQVFHSIQATPGEEFNISAVIVGSEFGTARGSIYAQFLSINNKYEPSLEQQYHTTQGIQIRGHKSCTKLEYSVLSANEREVIVLTAIAGTVSTYGNYQTLQEYISLFEESGIIPPQLLTTPVYINMTMLPCPVGFVLDSNPPRCECYAILKINFISCRVSGGGNGYVTRNRTLWVNGSFNGENSTGVFLHKYCPFGYCNPQQVTFDLANDPDAQCAFKRSGILCGACKPGYSAALGSSKCLQCSNSYLALVLVFGVAGILLVLFIKVLDLTVAHGTINGLIFYANIVWVNQSILFPNDGHTNGATMILKTFIAWLNLDLGIETCFVNGLDGYWKTWLQFVFPFYIWSLAGMIIITSRHSRLLTKFFGNNSVSVLATLFLLSYSKLLHTIITALNVTYLVDYPNGYRLAVWSFDGNLKYCGIPHVFLFLFSIVILVALWMPYTTVLLSIQLLRMVSERRIFRWVDKMKPIFDAYFSPLKDRHHYWIGVQLIARGILMITFSQTSTNVPTANFIAMTTVSAALLFYVAQAGYLYKKLYVSFLETTFLLNLVLLGAAALFINLTEGNKTALILVSVGTAFIQFVILLLVHLQTIFKGCYNKFKHVKRGDYENIEEAEIPVVHRRQNVSTSYVDKPGTQQSASETKFREPLLEFEQPTLL